MTTIVSFTDGDNAMEDDAVVVAPPCEFCEVLASLKMHPVFSASDCLQIGIKRYFWCMIPVQFQLYITQAGL